MPQCANPTCQKPLTDPKRTYCSRRCGWMQATKPSIGHDRSMKGTGESWWLNDPATFYSEARKRFPYDPGVMTAGWGGAA